MFHNVPNQNECFDLLSTSGLLSCILLIYVTRLTLAHFIVPSFFGQKFLSLSILTSYRKSAATALLPVVHAVQAAAPYIAALPGKSAELATAIYRSQVVRRNLFRGIGAVGAGYLAHRYQYQRHGPWWHSVLRSALPSAGYFFNRGVEEAFPDDRKPSRVYSYGTFPTGGRFVPSWSQSRRSFRRSYRKKRKFRRYRGSSRF